MADGCVMTASMPGVTLVNLTKDDTTRVKLTQVNPHLVCVLCHGYFVDATTITECLHSFCRSCIFRHLEKKSICPICEVPVHTRLHRSLKPDKTLQDIVYKLVPGLFHNEMERRRAFYKQHPFRDEHLEPERRGLGLDRLIYSPTDTISLSLEFYDTEREREEWSSVTCPPPHPTQESPVTNTSNNNNNNKRYLQCPAIFKMAHLKKFLRQKYNLPPTANVEIIYKREFLPDSYSLMDVAYIYTWKRNGPMRFYYRIPDVVETNSHDLKPSLEKQGVKVKSPPSVPLSSSPESDLERNKQVLSAANIPVETAEKKLLPLQVAPLDGMQVNDKKNQESVDTKPISEPTQSPVQNHMYNSEKLVSQNTTPNDKKQVPEKPNPTLSPKDSQTTKVPTPETTSNILPVNKSESPVPKVPKQDQLPVEVLLSLSTCRVSKDGQPSNDTIKVVKPKSDVKELPRLNATPKVKQCNNARMSLNKIANELQQKAAANSFIQKTTKENPTSPSKANTGEKLSPNSKSSNPKIYNSPTNNINGRLNGNKRKPTSLTAVPTKQGFNDVSVMDHRIQQLYKFPGTPTNNSPTNGVTPIGQKTSRLASWLNNRFQNKPPGSPAHPGCASPAHPGSASPAHTGSVPPAHLGSASPARLGSASPIHLGSASPAHPGIANLPGHLVSKTSSHSTVPGHPSKSSYPSSPVHSSHSGYNGTPVVSGKQVLSGKGAFPNKSSHSGISVDKASHLARSVVSSSPANPRNSSHVPHPTSSPNLPDVTAKINDTKSETPSMKSSLQNSIPASIKSTHQNIPPQVGFFNKSHTNNIPAKTAAQMTKKPYPEKQEKNNDIPILLSNGISVQKDHESKKESVTKPPLPNSPVKQSLNGSVKPLGSPTQPIKSSVSEKSTIKIDEKIKTGKPFNNVINVPSVTSFVKDQGLVIPEPCLNGSAKVPTSTSSSLNKSSQSIKDNNQVNRENTKVSSTPTSEKDDKESKQDMQEENKEDSSKLDEEVNRLKRKLEEMRKMSNVKGKEIGGCQITHENPDPEEAKRRRDLTPVVSIELMRGCKRPVPGLKAIQDTDIGKRKDEKKDVPDKKLKLSTKKELKKEDGCALDLSRCTIPPNSTPPHPWFNPLLHQQFLPSSK